MAYCRKTAYAIVFGTEAGAILTRGSGADGAVRGPDGTAKKNTEARA